MKGHTLLSEHKGTLEHAIDRSNWKIMIDQSDKIGRIINQDLVDLNTTKLSFSNKKM